MCCSDPLVPIKKDMFEEIFSHILGKLTNPLEILEECVPSHAQFRLHAKNSVRDL